MNDLCNLENVVFQGIIFPKENIENRKNLYRNFIDEIIFALRNYLHWSLYQEYLDIWFLNNLIVLTE